MILEIFSKFTPDVVDKGLVVPKVFLEEGFKVRLRNRSGAFMAALILSSSEADSATEV